MARSRLRLVSVGASIFGLLIAASILLCLWTDLQVAGSTVLLSGYTDDAYLELIVEWEAPETVIGLLSRLIRIEDFEWRDESGQFVHTGELYAVVDQQMETNVLYSVESDDTRTLVPITGKRLSECGLFTIRHPQAIARYWSPAKRIFLYYGVAYTGHPAITETTGPYVMKLTYSVLGFRRGTTHTNNLGDVVSQMEPNEDIRQVERTTTVDLPLPKREGYT